MPTPADLYIEGIRKKLKNYYAAWLPNEKLRLGDVGVLRGKLFTRVTSLADLGITFAERPDADPTPIDYVSESGVSMYFKGAGEVNTNLPNVPEGKAGVGVEFSREGAFVLKAPESYEPSIENIAQLEGQLIEAYKAGRWKSDWAVIVRLVQTPLATIMVSNSSQSKIEFSAEGSLPPGAPVDLGSAGIEFGVKVQKGDVIKFVGAKNLTPLFQLAKVMSKPWWNPWGGPSFAVRSARGEASPMSAITPERVRDDPQVAESLYLGLVSDTEEK